MDKSSIWSVSIQPSNAPNRVLVYDPLHMITEKSVLDGRDNSSLTPEKAIAHHRACYDQLCDMKNRLLSDELSSEHLKSGAHVDDDGTPISYLDPYILFHYTEMIRLQESLSA